MQLSIRVGLIIGTLSIAISTMVAGVSYYYQLEKASQQSQQLVAQMAENANRTSAIAAYLNDAELAGEIVAGLANNDLIAGATISAPDAQLLISDGAVVPSVDIIIVPLFNPFVEDDILGSLLVYPDLKFIQGQASTNSMQNAVLLIILSVLIAIFVGIYVRSKLTRPLKSLAKEFSNINTSAPDEMQAVEIGYSKKDEIGLLVSNINELIIALQRQFRSERDLRKTTEKLQKRYRLLFEQATSGIGVLTSKGIVSIANPAFNELFGENTEGSNLAKYFESPDKLTAQIASVCTGLAYTQLEVDLVSYNNGEKRYLHCLFSNIEDERGLAREKSDHMIEVVIYDVTKRRQEEAKARYEADHDSLTSLLNRRSGAGKLSEQLRLSAEHGLSFALIMMDLDKFKPVNDTHGHDVGDLVLTTISRRLSRLSEHQMTTLIRWGGDEFLIALSVKDEKEIASYAQQVLSDVKKEVAVSTSLKVSVGASLGIIKVAPDLAATAEIETLISSADGLMYQVKEKYRNNFTIVNYKAIDAS